MNILDLTNLSIEHNKLLNEISNEIKSDYHILINKIYSKADHNIFWYVNSLVSRNNFVSEVFLNLCYLELVKKILNNNQIYEIIVLNKAQKDILKNYYKDKKIKIKLVFNAKGQIKNFLTPFYTFYLNILFIFSSILASNNERRKTFLNKKTEITLIDTFVTPFEFKSGKYESRHYPKDELWDFLSLNEKKSVYFIPEIVGTNNITSVIRKLNFSDQNFIFKNDFLKLSDYFKALIGPLLMKKINFNSFIFRDFKISPLLKTDFYFNITNTNSFKGILNYYFFKRAKKYNLKFKLIVNWFENQSFDKGFNFGARKFYPKTDVIGFQPFVQDLNFQFHLCPIEIEESCKVIPKSIIVIGKKYKKLIKQFNLNLCVNHGPSIRYSYLHNKNKKPMAFKNEFILIVLPISLKQSCDIIKVINELYNNNNKFFNSKTWILKPHPDLKLNSIESEFRDLFKVLKIENQSVDSLIHKSGLVITNGSSVAIEAVVLGRPVCIIGAQNGLTQNPIPQNINPGIWRLCYNEHDLYNYLTQIMLYRKQDYMELMEIGNKIKSEYFEPVNLNSIKSFLQLK
tara:strand:+ start:194 stop:1903 length:1710 start_codon:yes stop_codon:yes gene_type:complete